MKKVLFILGAAALVLASCAKSETVVKETTPGEISFKAVAGTMTKGAELTGNHLFTNWSIYAAATQKNSAGIVENPSFFATATEMQFKNGSESTDPAAAVAADTPWHAATKSYWPLGGVKMDFLAYAMPIADHNDIPTVDPTPSAASADWIAWWNYKTTDAASMVSFNDVNTYDNQVDVLYAVANDRTSANSGASAYVPMTFNHAQALLIFNVKRNALDPLPALVINEIAFISEARVKDLQKEIYDGTDPGTLEDDETTLKTVGTFTVDNTRNKLIANWTFQTSDNSAVDYAYDNTNYKMPDGVTAKSTSNLAAVSGVVDYGSAISNTAAYAQLGETLLIPEQEKVNFTIKYTLAGNTYYHTYNDLRGVWEKGKKYIYNIDIALQEIIITETVEDWAPGFDPEGDKSEEIPLS